MNSRLTLYIPVFSQAIAGKRFSATGQNPGVGGTQFTSVKLAILLADTYPGLDVRLVNPSDILLDRTPVNLKIFNAIDLGNFFSSTDFESGPTVILATMSILKQVDTDALREHRNRIIAWQHHPFNLDVRIVRMGIRAHVSVGSYQYYSNRPFYGSMWHIQNPFTAVTVDRSPSTLKGGGGSRRTRIVFLGALIRAKGFLHIAKQWHAIQNVIPGAELHVIGSSATYGKQPEHSIVPCDRDLATDILNFIPKRDIDDGRVTFHGNLGDERFDILKNADVAILNPTGQTEAFPASPLECMATGVPVIASDEYGMSDTMSFFPELAIKRPEQVADRLKWLFSDNLRYEELRQRAFTVADWFDSQTGLILARWRRLFQLMIDSNDPIENNPPMESLYGSRLRFFMTIVRVVLLQVRQYLRRLVHNSYNMSFQMKKALECFFDNFFRKF